MALRSLLSGLLYGDLLCEWNRRSTRVSRVSVPHWFMCHA